MTLVLKMNKKVNSNDNETCKTVEQWHVMAHQNDKITAHHLFPVYLEITIKLPFKFLFKEEQRFTVDYSMEVV